MAKKPDAKSEVRISTSEDAELAVKEYLATVGRPKTRGRQISVKDVSSINSKPSRGWDLEAATTQLQFT